jgi:hypothetical protein
MSSIWMRLGFFYKVKPNKTLATKRLTRKKVSKEKITIALTSNADGTYILPPLIIN